jgi:crotonobetainyl-CoA:carnitine CoA-transferase CaiB-like acyl-CoA transferase
VQVAVLANQAANYLVGGMVPQRLGNAHPNIVPYQAFATSDGHVILAVGNDAQFHKFCAVAGCPDVAADPRYASNAGRVGNRDSLIPRLRQVLASRPSAAWIETLEAAGVPCGPINTLDQVFDNPQIKHRGMVAAVDHPLAGSVDLVANPIRFSETPISYERAPPVLGADTDALLSRLLGLDQAAIADLRARGVVGV